MPDLAPRQYLFFSVVNRESSVDVDVSLIPLCATLPLWDEMYSCHWLQRQPLIPLRTSCISAAPRLYDTSAFMPHSSIDLFSVI